MSPFLDSETHFEERWVGKYITFNGHIYYSDAKDVMGVASEKHSTLALRAGATDKIDDKPIVDDAGTVGFYDNKFRFSGSSGTCHVKNETKGKEVTRSIAINVLGKDRVD